MVTSRDVAKAAGVSQSMVSFVLNNVPDIKIKEETREKVIRAARELNYQININAKNMRTNKAMSIGLLSSWETSSFVYAPIIDGLKSVCEKNNISITLCSGKKTINGSFDYIDYYLQNRIDGIAYISYVGVTYDGIIENLIKHDIPYICIIGARDLPGVSSVDVNFIESGYMAGKHLADKGYKNCAYLFSDDITELTYGEKERLKGVQDVSLSLSIRITPIQLSLKTASEGEAINKAFDIIRTNSFDSIVSTSYICFIMSKAAAILGIKVPKDIGIISLDNESYAPYLYPSLTTVDEPLFKIAAKAADILFDKIEGSTSCEKIELSPSISFRESTML
jgi:DNA-binding LacI/PurR family transcriptional regulator